MAKLQPIIVFHDRHFVRHFGICNPSCVKRLQVMSGVIPRNLKKTYLYHTVFLTSINAAYTHRDTHTDTHTHTHDDYIRRNAMRCISPKNDEDIESNRTNIDIYHFLQSLLIISDIFCQ